jgi:hypothetical protein
MVTAEAVNLEQFSNRYALANDVAAINSGAAGA